MLNHIPRVTLTTPSFIKMLFVVTCTLFIIIGVQFITPVLNPLLVGLIIAIFCTPLLYWLQRKGLPRWLALLIMLLVVLGLGLVVIFIVAHSVEQLSNSLDTYRDRLAVLQAEAVAFVSRLGVPNAEEALPLETVNPQTVIAAAVWVINGVSQTLSQAFLILLVAGFALIEAAVLPAKIEAGLGADNRLLQQFKIFSADVVRYLALKSWVSLLTGIIIALWTWLLGLDFFLLWGLVGFIFNYIPVVGPILAAIPALFLALVQFGPRIAIIVAIGYYLINVIVSLAIEPRMMGKGLDLSIFAVFFSVFFFAWVLGPIGMFVAIPVLVLLKFILNSYEETRWLAVAMGSQVPPQAPPVSSEDGQTKED